MTGKKYQSPRLLENQEENKRKKSLSLLNRDNATMNKTKRATRGNIKGPFMCPICNKKLEGRAYERDKHIDDCITESHEALKIQNQKTRITDNNKNKNRNKNGNRSIKKIENNNKNGSESKTRKKNKKEIQTNNIYAIIPLNDKGDSNGKCCVCLGSYEKPLVNTTCWHVLCQECWSSVLKKVHQCPKCMTAMQQKNLQRIYF